MNIVSIEILSRGRYTPSRDPQGSLVLVAFLRRGSESEPYVEVLASFGAGYEWAVDGDRQTTWRAFAEALDDEPDGLYVLGCGWEGSGEDSDFVVFDSAAPTDEERAFISANSDFSGIEHHWAARWAGVPCRECKKPVEDHAGFEFACPSATPAAVWKEEEASMNRSRVDTEIDRLRGEPAKNRDKPESVAADMRRRGDSPHSPRNASPSRTTKSRPSRESGWTDGAMDEPGWYDIDGIDGPNAICWQCAGSGAYAGLRGAWPSAALGVPRPVRKRDSPPTNPPPSGGTGDVWQELIATAECAGFGQRLLDAMAARRTLGIERYGQPLRRGDGRDHRLDLLEELLDAAVYAYADGTTIAAFDVLDMAARVIR